MRHTVLTALVALLVVSAGCTALLSGDTIEFSANEASVDDSTLESTGYEGQNATEQTISRNVTVGGQERTVEITNHFARYSRTGSLAGATNGSEEQPTAVSESESATATGTAEAEISQFIVLSTPGAQMAGQTLNPAASWSNERIVDQVAERTGSIEDVEFQENRTTESLGAEREVGVFNGTTEMEGEEVDVRLHVASFEHEGDVLIVVGIHPQEIEEEENIDELFGGIEHSGDE